LAKVEVWLLGNVNVVKSIFAKEIIAKLQLGARLLQSVLRH
jgi:hypothetical protein